ncbi:MAG: DUF58 domain-containing protein [Actinomycetota bacterium]|nr:DUF58 domain-containing protein [Actinomycetota bacterium]
MPTARGWAVAGAGLVLLVMGRVFGASALGQTGFALVVLVAAALVVVRARRHDISVTRGIAPEKATAGLPVTISLRFANEGRGAAPLVLVQDHLPVTLSGQARFAVPGIEPGGARETSFTVRPPRRGRYEVGPLDMAFVDPFGLAQITARAVGTTSFIVHPRVEPLSLPRDLGQQRSLGASHLRQPTGTSGDDFYTLREYAEGDDLRKIHWPSTAKRARYMIRQEETAWHTRSTVVLDDRSEAYEGPGGSAAFERAVEAAASVAGLYDRSGYSYRLACAHAPGLASGRGRTHLHRCLDLLATIEPTATRQGGASDRLLVRLAEIEAAGNAGGTFVLISGALTPELAVGLSRIQRVFRQVIAISFPGFRYGQTPARSIVEAEKQTGQVTRLLVASGIRPVILSPGEPLTAGWSSLSLSRWQGGDRSSTRRSEHV